MTDPRHRNLVAGKHILRCLHGTVAYGLRYASNGGVLLFVYINSNWYGSIVDRKSTSGYCFSLGSTMIYWYSRKNGSVT